MRDNSELDDLYGFDEVASTKAADDLNRFTRYIKDISCGNLNLLSSAKLGEKSNKVVIKRLPRKRKNVSNLEPGIVKSKRTITIKKIKYTNVGNASMNMKKARRSKSFTPEYYGLKDSLLYEPFNYGWRRELVKYGDRYGYVCYHTPYDEKLKSLEEVENYLRFSREPLTVENFTFCKEPLKYIDAEKQFITEPVILKRIRKNLPEATSQKRRPVTIIRVTKGFDKSSLKSNSTLKHTPKPPKNFGNKVVILAKSRSKQWRPEISDKYYNEQDVGGSFTTEVFKNNNVKVSSNLMNNKVFKNKLDRKKEQPKMKMSKSDQSEEFQVGMLPPEWIPADKVSNLSSSTPVSGTTLHNNEREVCPITCRLASGVVPNLQCSSCICMFHYECSGLDQNMPVKHFVCKNCREKCKANSSIPVSSDVANSDSDTTVIASAITVTSASASLPLKPMKIVDGVTTWLPSSSSIQISKNPGTTLNPHLSTSTNNNDIGQEVVEIGGKYYIAVRKHSVMSVVSNSSTTKSSGRTTSQNAVVKDKQRTTIELDDNKSIDTDNLKTIKSDVRLLSDTQNLQNNSTNGVLIIPCGHPTDYRDSTIHDGKKLSDSGEEEDISRKSMNRIRSSLKPELKCISKLDEISDPLYGRFHEVRGLLIQALSYLKVDELLRVARVNKFFNQLATDPSLWQIVKLKNCKVYDWEACIDTLCKRNTRRLDLRRMLLPNKSEGIETMWTSLLKALSRMTGLEEIDLCRCNADTLNMVAAACSNLKVFNAPFTNSKNIEFKNISNLTELRGLVIKGMNCERIEHLERIANYDQLTTLSLTNITKLEPSTVSVVAKMKNLDYLALGDCTYLFTDETFRVVLKHLSKLKVLRLETVKSIHPEYDIYSAIGQLPSLTSLELVNIEIRDGFDVLFPQCKNIEQLLLLPTYVSQAAATNRLVINGLKGLSSTLKYLLWGLTTDLFKMTNLFIEKQSQESSNLSYGDVSSTVNSNLKKQVQESIPVLKLTSGGGSTAEDEGGQVSQIAILTCQKLERVVRALLPYTRVKISKVPASSATRPNLISL